MHLDEHDVPDLQHIWVVLVHKRRCVTAADAVVVQLCSMRGVSGAEQSDSIALVSHELSRWQQSTQRCSLETSTLGMRFPTHAVNHLRT